MAAFPDAGSVDPFKVVGPEVAQISANIKGLLGVDHKVLATVAKYFFEQDGGKKIRPVMVMLVGQALNEHMATLKPTRSQPDAAHHATALEESTAALGLTPDMLWASQQRLAEIAEMIHTASLLHDDVIDDADTRRGRASVNAMFGNKLAILAGDFMLARASVCLARLRNVPTVEVISTIIEHLVKGEVMQMAGVNWAGSGDGESRPFRNYIAKTYYKTGSLMANTCRSTALLGGFPDELEQAAFEYGKHLGVAFQLVDDLLDFSGTVEGLGKPALNDIAHGLVTAPVLFAASSRPELLPMIERKFSRPGDVEAAVAAVQAAGGVEDTRQLAVAHAQYALDQIAPLAPSPARSALAALAVKVIDRSR